jgi:glutamine amidotransferase
VPEDKGIIAATTEYGIEFVSAIAKGNVFGVQFHPEKSGEVGLQVLRNFGDLL